jgi:predicted amidohydrolase
MNVEIRINAVRFDQTDYLFKKKMMKILRFIVLFFLGLILLAWIWSMLGRVGDQPLSQAPDLKGLEMVSYGNSDSAQGNIIGMQPFLTTIDYANEASFYQVLRANLLQAKANGFLNIKTIVVFPEYIGSWLVAANEKKKLFDSSRTIVDALTFQVFSNLLKFIPAYFNSVSADKAREAIFRMKQPEITGIYQSVFSRLAREFQVTIVAGSAVMADPSVDADGKIKTGTGKLYNTSVVFDAQGKIMLPLIRKIFPTSEENGFTCAADTAQAPVFQVPAGRLAVLVCADSWFPAAYKNLQNRVDVIAIPSLGGPDAVWTSPWEGYSGFPAPADVDTLADYHHITEGDAWVKYAMAKRAVQAGIHNGMNVFFAGDLWDLHPEGRVLTLEMDSLHVSAPAVKKGRITNLWFRQNK